MVWENSYRIVINQIEKIAQSAFKDKDIILICTHEGSGFSSTMNEIKEKITNSNDISQGKRMRGSEVEQKINEIESFAKSIANKYGIEETNTTKNEEAIKSNENNKDDETTDIIESSDTDSISKFVSNEVYLAFKFWILYSLIFILL